ncbi:MAG: hypothetical protein WC565_09075 [Parcubacteria group bacterium]|jgi:hypothetical protein
MDAKVVITYAGTTGDLPTPMDYDASDADIRRWATESVQTGSVAGIAADPTADLSDFIIDRSPANEERPTPLILVRPKTAFGV